MRAVRKTIATLAVFGVVAIGVFVLRATSNPVCSGNIIVPDRPISGRSIADVDLDKITDSNTIETLRNGQRIWYKIPARHKMAGLATHDRVVIVLYTPDMGWDYLRIAVAGVTIRYNITAARKICDQNCAFIWQKGAHDFAYLRHGETPIEVFDNVTRFETSMHMVSDGRLMSVYTKTTKNQNHAQCLMNDTLAQIFAQVSQLPPAT